MVGKSAKSKDASSKIDSAQTIIDARLEQGFWQRIQDNLPFIAIITALIFSFSALTLSSLPLLYAYFSPQVEKPWEADILQLNEGLALLSVRLEQNSAQITGLQNMLTEEDAAATAQIEEIVARIAKAEEALQQTRQQISQLSSENAADSQQQNGDTSQTETDKNIIAPLADEQVVQGKKDHQQDSQGIVLDRDNIAQNSSQETGLLEWLSQTSSSVFSSVGKMFSSVIRISPADEEKP